jgi:hypothetical protein
VLEKAKRLGWAESTSRFDFVEQPCWRPTVGIFCPSLAHANENAPMTVQGKCDQLFRNQIFDGFFEEVPYLYSWHKSWGLWGLRATGTFTYLLYEPAKTKAASHPMKGSLGIFLYCKVGGVGGSEQERGNLKKHLTARGCFATACFL